MSLITFDWAQIAYIGSPLATPWWAEANIAAGFVFFFWLLVPVLYVSFASCLEIYMFKILHSTRTSGSRNSCREFLWFRHEFNSEQTDISGSHRVVPSITLATLTTCP